MSNDGRGPFVIHDIANGHAVSHKNKGRIVSFLGDMQRKAAIATPNELADCGREATSRSASHLCIDASDILSR